MKKALNLFTKALAFTLPFLIIYLLSAFILGNWNILQYSELEKVIIVLASVWNIPTAMNGLKRSITDIIYILVMVIMFCIYGYLVCAFCANSLNISSFPIADKVLAAIIVEIMTVFSYLNCEKDVAIKEVG